MNQTDLLLEDKAAQERGTVLRGHRVEQSAKHQFRQEQLVSRTDLARHSALHLHYIVMRRETQATEDSFSRFELLELQDIMDRVDLLFEVLDVLNGLLLAVILLKTGFEIGRIANLE